MNKNTSQKTGGCKAAESIATQLKTKDADFIKAHAQMRGLTLEQMSSVILKDWVTANLGDTEIVDSDENYLREVGL